jgi:plastocyanin
LNIASVARRVRIALLAVPLALAVVAASGNPAASHGNGLDVVIVDVVDFAYQPQTITIHVGDTVQWNNADDVDHTATSVDGAPAAFDVYLAAGAWGSFTFETAGTYDYFCIPHPTMTGTIVVEPAHEEDEAGSDGSEVPDVAMPAPPASAPAAFGVLVVLLGLAAALRRRGDA